MEGVAKICTRERCQGRLRVQWIARNQRLDCGAQTRDEGLGDRVDDDETLGRDTALAGVHETRARGGGDGLVEVGVLQHHEGVGAAELEHCPLEVLAGDGRDPSARRVAAREAHAAHARVGDDTLGAAGVDRQRAEDTVRGARVLE